MLYDIALSSNIPLGTLLTLKNRWKRLALQNWRSKTTENRYSNDKRLFAQEIIVQKVVTLKKAQK